VARLAHRTLFAATALPVTTLTPTHAERTMIAVNLFSADQQRDDLRRHKLDDDDEPNSRLRAENKCWLCRRTQS
jgi:hypothetical protein